MITAAFLLCIPVTLILFARMQPGLALIWSVLLTYLFLPERAGFDMPGIPAMDKTSIPVLTILLAIVVFGGRDKIRNGRRDASAQVPGDRAFGILIACLCIMMLVAPVFTTLTNDDPLRFGPVVIPGARPWDIVGQFANTIFILIPFLLARRYLSTPEAHRQLLVALVVAGLGYSFLALIEIRLSPQLHNWVYGFHQHSFLQHIRGGAFRPKVFLDHGLSVGLFFSGAVFAAIAVMCGMEAGRRRTWGFAGLWLFLILLNSQNLGAVLITLAMAPIFLLPMRWQLRATTLIAVSFLLFPVLRQAGIVPVDRMAALAEGLQKVVLSRSFTASTTKTSCWLAASSGRRSGGAAGAATGSTTWTRATTYRRPTGCGSSSWVRVDGLAT